MARRVLTRRIIERHRMLIQQCAAREQDRLARCSAEMMALWALALVYCAERATDGFSQAVAEKLVGLPESVKTLALSYVALGLRQN